MVGIQTVHFVYDCRFWLVLTGMMIILARVGFSERFSRDGYGSYNLLMGCPLIDGIGARGIIDATKLLSAGR